MLIQGVRPDISGAEKKIVDWLRSSSIRAVPGIALSGQYVPPSKAGRKGPHSSEADLILITREQLIVIEVKGQILPGSGVLFCPPSDRWKLDGHNGDPVHVRRGDRNPLDQVRALMFDVKHLAENAIGKEAYVSAVVMVVPMDRHILTLDVLPPPHGCDVLLADSPTVLQGMLEPSGRPKESWTAGRVQKVLRALGVTSINYDDLVREGFTDDGEGSAPSEVPAPARTVMPTSAVPFPAGALGSLPPISRVPLPTAPRRRTVEVKSAGWGPLVGMGALAVVLAALWVWSDHERRESTPPTSNVETSEQSRVTVEPVTPCFPFGGGC